MGLTRIRAEQISNSDYKQSVRVLATENVILSGGAPAQVDGVNLSVNDRILIINQDVASENGIYRVQTLGLGENGTWIRSTDANETGEVLAGMITMVTEGIQYADTQWKLITNDPIVIDETPLEFRRNGAFEFGNVVANNTAILAQTVGDTLTITPGDNISIIGNATAKSMIIGVTGISLNSISNGTSNVNVVSSGGNVTFGINGTSNTAVFEQFNTTFAGNVLPSTNIVYDLGSATQRWRDIWLANSTIYLGNAQISANATAITIRNPAGGNTIFSGANPDLQVASVTATGNITTLTGNVTGGNLKTNSVIIGNSTISGVTTISASGNANVGNISAATATFTNIAGTLTTTSQPNITSVGTLTSLAVSGNVTTGNVSGTTGAFTNVSGNGVALTGINASNIASGTLAAARLSGSYTINIAGAATTAATITTAAQPNITSVGTLTSLAVSGNVTTGNVSGTTVTGTNVKGGNITISGDLISSSGNIITIDPATAGPGGLVVIDGNLQVTGTTTTIDSTTVTINDLMINVANNAANATQATGAGIGVGPVGTEYASWTYNSSSNVWTTAQGITATGNISGGNVSGTTGAFTNVSGNGVALTGINASNIASGTLAAARLSGSYTINIAGAATTAATVTTAAQPNITSVGTLTSLAVSGNVTTGNVSGTTVSGTTGAFTNVSGNGSALTAINASNISTGTLAQARLANAAVTLGSTTLTLGATVTTVAGLSSVTSTTFVGALTGAATTAATVTTAAQPNITSVGTLTSLAVSGNVTTGNVSGTTVSGTTGAFTNVSGNGSALTAINASNISTGTLAQARLANAAVTLGSTTLTLGATVTTVAGLSSVTSTTFVGALTGAATTAATVTTAAQPNITSVGTLTSLAVSGNVTTGNVSGTTGAFTNVSGNGSALTGINASNIASGTLAAARLSGSYTINIAGAATTAATVTTAAQPNITSVGNLTSLVVTGNINANNLNTTNEVRFFDSGNVNYVGFRSANTVASNLIWTLPATDGTLGQALVTNGSGELTWAAGGGGGGGISWTTQANTPPIIAIPGDFWYDSTSQIKYQYVNDGTGNVWVDQSFPTVFETVTTGTLVNSNANGVGNIGTSSGFFNTAFVQQVTTGTLVNSNANGVGNIGSSTGFFNTVFAKATSAQYADLAEIYTADAEYEAGTVVVFGGSAEVTITAVECDTRVAGVVSTNPAYVMNAGTDGIVVALTGRVPCQVQGPVSKGDVLITGIVPGTAKRIGNSWQPGCVIGKSLETIKDESVKTIEIAVGRF